MATILVTGASGFVGSYVVPALLEREHRVVALVRDERAGARVVGRVVPARQSAVELRHGDVTDAATLGAAMAGVDAVVHLVAIPRDRDGGASLRLVNTEGTRNVIEAMKASGVRRLVHLGGMGIEDDPALHFASSKAKGEALVRDSDLDWTILKPSLMWGERDGFFNILAGLVRTSPGIVPVPGDGGARFQPIAVLECARIVGIALGDDATVGRAFDLGGPRYWTYKEIVREVMAAMGAKRAIVGVPVPLISLVARTGEALRIPFPVASDQLRQLRLDNITERLDAVEADFGFAPTDMAGQLGYLRRKPKDQDRVVPSSATTAG